MTRLKGLSFCFFLAGLLGHSAYGQELAWLQRSLFFAPQAPSKSKKKTAEPAVSVDAQLSLREIRVDGIFFSTSHNWCIWINGVLVTSEDKEKSLAGISIQQVSPTHVTFQYESSASRKKITFLLRVGQGYCPATGRVSHVF